MHLHVAYYVCVFVKWRPGLIWLGNGQNQLAVPTQPAVVCMALYVPPHHGWWYSWSSCECLAWLQEVVSAGSAYIVHVVCTYVRTCMSITCTQHQQASSAGAKPSLDYEPEDEEDAEEQRRFEEQLQQWKKTDVCTCTYVYRALAMQACLGRCSSFSFEVASGMHE